MSNTYNNVETEKTLTGLFNNRQAAEKAYETVVQNGYSPQDVSIIMSEASRQKYYDSELVKLKSSNKSLEGLAIGGAVGGVAGGAVAALAAMGTSLLIPGLNLIVAGPLAAALAGAGAGSVAGGFIGSLVGLGVPEERAALYDAGVKKGDILIAVHKKQTARNQIIMDDWQQSATAS